MRLAKSPFELYSEEYMTERLSNNKKMLKELETIRQQREKYPMKLYDAQSDMIENIPDHTGLVKEVLEDEIEFLTNKLIEINN